jgi:rhodanese-related sulfurtransferase
MSKAKSSAHNGASKHNETSKKKKASNQQSNLVIFSVLGLFVIVAMIAGIALTAAPTPKASVMQSLPTALAVETPVASLTQVVTSALPAEVSVAEARQMQQDGAFVLDVRQPEEWSAEHIEGATLIPLGELSGRLAEVPNNQPIVVVCRSGNRSAQGRDLLLSAGYGQVTSMAGGMKSWVANGLPVVTGP